MHKHVMACTACASGLPDRRGQNTITSGRVWLRALTESNASANVREQSHICTRRGVRHGLHDASPLSKAQVLRPGGRAFDGFECTLRATTHGHAVHTLRVAASLAARRWSLEAGSGAYGRRAGCRARHHATRAGGLLTPARLLPATINETGRVSRHTIESTASRGQHERPPGSPSCAARLFDAIPKQRPCPRLLMMPAPSPHAFTRCNAGEGGGGGRALRESHANSFDAFVAHAHRRGRRVAL